MELLQIVAVNQLRLVLKGNKYNMPYKNLQLYPVQYSEQNTNKLSQYYRGFSTANPLNRGSQLYDFDLIKQDILNQFNTRKGQRVMNPTFGSIIWDILMEPLTPKISELLQQDISTICNSDPRVYPLQMKVNEYEQGYLIEITLAMKNTNESSTLKLAFDQKLGIVVQ
jgi:phage baseplate assembly protein W